MEGSSLITYIICMLLIVDYYDECVPSHTKVMCLFVRSPLKCILYTFRFVIKRRKFQYVFFLFLGIVFSFFDTSFLIYFIFSIVVSFVSPFLSFNKTFLFLRYIVYGIPLGMLYFDIYSFIYIYIICLLIILSLLMMKVDISPYQKRVLEGKIYRKKVKRFIYPIILIVTFIVLQKNDILEKMPIEQGLVFLLLYLITQTEVGITENKLKLLTYKARVYLNIIKCSKINFKVFNRQQIAKIVSNLGTIMTLLICLGIYNDIILDYIILLLAAVVLLLSSIDVFLYHYILQRSIAYNNTVVRNLIVLGINYLVFQFIMYYSVHKNYSNMQMPKELFIIFRGGFSFVFIMLICMYIYRYKNLLKTNTLLPSKKGNSF